MAGKTNWKDYNLNGSVSPPRPRLVKTLEIYFPNRFGKALDLGCGGGRDTKELLTKGWTVDAVDSDDSAIELTSELTKSFPLLSVIQSDFESFSPPEMTYDLINASYSLPFCSPQIFPSFWRKLTRALKPGGIISCELFGTNDSWAQDPAYGPKMTFFKKSDVQDDLLKGMTVEILKEDESDSPSFSGPMKHWHVFLCVAKRPEN